MKTIILIILVVAAIGAIFGFFSGEKKGEDAAAGAVGGAVLAGGCLFQLFIYGLIFAAAIWVVSLVFS